MDYDKLSSGRLGESSCAIRARVQAARQRHIVPMVLRETERFKGSDIVCNTDMRVADVRKFCMLDETGDSLVPAKNGTIPCARP